MAILILCIIKSSFISVINSLNSFSEPIKQELTDEQELSDKSGENQWYKWTMEAEMAEAGMSSSKHNLN